MECESIQVKVMMQNKSFAICDLVLFEEDSDNNIVSLELILGERKITGKSDNFFDALIYLRKELEKIDCFIMCNGAAENVYPSPMQQSMGTGRVAYKLSFKQKAKMADIVDIFECDETLNFVSIENQLKFNIEWQESITE